jgi:hypothetical protein
MQAEKILDFTCPHGSDVQSDEVVLQFGDHEHFPKVRICLVTLLEFHY